MPSTTWGGAARPATELGQTLGFVMEKVIERLRVVLRRVLQIARVLGVCGGGWLGALFVLISFYGYFLTPLYLQVPNGSGFWGRLEAEEGSELAAAAQEPLAFPRAATPEPRSLRTARRGGLFPSSPLGGRRGGGCWPPAEQGRRRKLRCCPAPLAQPRSRSERVPAPGEGGGRRWSRG